MAKVECPYEIDGKHLILHIPDRFTVRHYEKWSKGSRQARETFGDDASLGVCNLFGSIALCDQIENMPETGVEDWPLEVFTWITGEVYTKRFSKGLFPQIPEANGVTPE